MPKQTGSGEIAVPRISPKDPRRAKKLASSAGPAFQGLRLDRWFQPTDLMSRRHPLLPVRVNRVRPKRTLAIKRTLTGPVPVRRSFGGSWVEKELTGFNVLY